MRLLFIRHGDPDYEHDSLTPKGEREAELLADKMEGEQLTHIYISPLGRAQRTAAATLKRLRREGTTLDWLREFTYPVRLPDTGEEHLIWDFMPAFMRSYPQLYSAEGWQTPEFIRNSGVPRAYAAAPTSVTTVYTEEREEGIASFRCASYGDISHLYAAHEPPSFSARFCETFANQDERH